MDIDDVRVFITVVRENSFSRAASRLHRSQPVISQTVRRLEAQLGESLFDRSSKGAALTDAGKLFREYAERLVSLAEKASNLLHELKDVKRGRVVIGANEGAVATLLPFISAFTATHDQIVVEVRRIRARDVGGELAHGNVDFGVTTFRPTQKGLKAITLQADEMVALVRPDHPFARMPRVTLAEWSAQPIIVHSDPSPARESVFRLVKKNHAPFNARVALPTIESMKEAVLAGLGITLLPRRCASSEIDAGRLVAIAVPELRLPHIVRLVYRKNSSLSHAANAFLTQLKQQVGGAGRPQ
jgi:DNA-binding transcriptional LysR family regulator